MTAGTSTRRPHYRHRAFAPPLRRSIIVAPKAGRTPLRRPRLGLLGVVVATCLALVGQSFVAAARENVANYKVQPGDTLLGISLATGVSIDQITTLNSLTDPNRIVAGRTLRLEPGAPLGETAADPAAKAEYVVRPGDTLWQIASSLGVPFKALVEANNLTDPNRLATGQRLRLPTDAKSGTLHKAASAPAATLTQRVVAAARKIGGDNLRLGVAAKNLGTGEQVMVRADEVFPSASVMKLPILVELERQVTAGKVSWSPSLRYQATAMMSVSDNTAANQIYDLVGEANVNATLKRLDLRRTRLINRFAETNSQRDPGYNQTSPADMAYLLEWIATDQLISPSVSADIRALLERNADRSKLVRPLPAGASVAHKSGWYTGVANDVGIVTTGNGARWVVAVFTEGVADPELGNQVVGAVSRTLYDAWEKKG